MGLKRRSFIKHVASVVGSASVLSHLSHASQSTDLKKKVVVVGGGFAGATAAKYIGMWSKDIEVTMIERNAQFVSCPQSNLVLGGNRSMQQLTSDYDSLTSKYGVKTIQSEVVAIDTEAKNITLSNGDTVNYHRLILAPGVDFIYDTVPELENNDKAPHAWKAGPQTALLRQQIVDMKQGGTVIMTIPATPFRCPPGPYERACQIAFYLKHHNPTAKLIVLDANADIVSKKTMFKSAWDKYYADIIEYVPNSTIETIDVENLAIETEFDSFKADVLNYIPSQKAGNIADMAGVNNVDQRWCKVDFLTYESTVKPNVHIIGDAIHAKLPKSGHMANAQAKVCAAAVISLLADQQPKQDLAFSNTCYSFVDDQQAGHVAANYSYDADKKQMVVMPGGGVSLEADELEGEYANGWAENIWDDVLR
ncbi:MAG: flavocytochrome C [Gammaproteobacteria bacterium]|nr:MAG: flavocytochrome C [Gammaproteobacteria bacterium]